MWKLLVFRLLIGSIVAVYMPFIILSPHPVPAPLPFNIHTITGVLLIAAGLAVYLRCAWDFAFIGGADNPNIIVAIGIYKFVRNPMYISLVLILLGESLMFRSWTLLGYTLVLWLFIHLLVILYEEHSLLKKFGASYEQYSKEVPRWIPTFKKK